MVIVGATEWLGDDPINDAELGEVLGAKFQCRSGFWSMFAMFPKNGGAAFRTDDRIVGVLHHEHAVSNADAECATAAAFTDDHSDDGRAEQHHLTQIECDGFGNVAFLSADAGESTGGVDQCDDGQAELLGETHHTQGLAVTFGMGAAEIAEEVFLGVAALLMTDDDDLLSAPDGKASGHGVVITHVAVTMDLNEFVAAMLHVIQHEGPVDVSGDLHALPWVEIGVDIALEGIGLLFQFGDLAGKLVTGFAGELLLRVLDFFAEFDDGFFEFQNLFHRQGKGWVGWLNG